MTPEHIELDLEMQARAHVLEAAEARLNQLMAGASWAVSAELGEAAQEASGAGLAFLGLMAPWAAVEAAHAKLEAAWLAAVGLGQGDTPRVPVSGLVRPTDGAPSWLEAETDQGVAS